ncbi:transposase [Priestia endophytica]|uniref:transposase n=1 Tax=Priestia endophytica TaxID=135735 RepID=UPI000DCA9036|nr:transposase [Priestia endophytica]RAS85092.1 transposase [Priestia endophytica]
MKIILILGSLIFPFIMLILQKKYTMLNFVFNVFAFLALLLFGDIVSLAIHDVLQEGRVFMTTIHAILLNPFLLISGTYIGVYLLYRILLLIVKER